jgi:O-antigen/teichoic acid export membrane protein
LKISSSILKAFSAISFLWFGSLAGAGLVFITNVVLARELTPSSYGVFAAALATVTLLIPLAGFGVHRFWLKAFGAEGWGAVRWLTQSFRFVILSTTVTVLLLAVWAAFGPHDESFSWLLYWLLPVVVGYVLIEMVSAKLQLEERYSALVLWRLMPNLARLLLVLLVVSSATGQVNLDTIAVVYAAVAFVIMIAVFVQLLAMVQGQFALKGHLKLSDAENIFQTKITSIVRVSDVARQTWPFALHDLFYLMYYQSAVILLIYLDSDQAAGIYNVAFTIMAAVYLLPDVIFQKYLLPKFHRWANYDRARFLEVYRAGNGGMLLLGVFASGTIMLLAPWVIPLLFGKAYQEAVSLLTILALCVPLHFLVISIGVTLETQENMRLKVYYMGVVGVINVLLNILIIPFYGAQGAAVSTLLCEIMLLTLYLLAVRKHVFGSDAWRGWSLNPTILMGKIKS